MMSNRLLSTTAALALLVLPVAAQAQTDTGAGVATGATTGAVGGAIVGGPVGAAVGAGVGAVVGGLSAEQSQQVRQYVVRNHRPSVRVQERVVVGEDLPRNVELYEVPADVGVRTEYRYSVVNDHTVLVDPRTRRIVQIID
jgi:uncharacterized protein YcfJ